MLLSIFGDSIMAGVVQENGRYSRCKEQFVSWRRRPG